MVVPVMRVALMVMSLMWVPLMVVPLTLDMVDVVAWPAPGPCLAVLMWFWG